MWLAVFAIACLSEIMAADQGDPTTLSGLRGVWRAHFNHDGSRVLVQLRGGKIGLWNTQTGKPVMGELGAMTQEGNCVMEHSGKLFVVGFAEGGVRVFDAATAAALSPTLKVRLVDKWQPQAVFSPDHRTLLLFDADCWTNVFDVESGRRLASIAPAAEPSDNVDSEMQCQFSKDGVLCFILDTRGTLARYNTSDWESTGKPMIHPNREGYSFGFQISHDGRLAVTSDGPGENGPKGYLQLWDMVNAHPIGKPLEAQNGLGASFLPDGKHLLVAPARGLAAVYELPSLKHDFNLPKHDEVDGPGVKLTPDGGWFLTWGYSMLILSDAGTGKRRNITSSKAHVSTVLVSPDSRHCYAVYDNTAFFLDGHHDHYVMKQSLPDFKAEGSIRILDTLSSVDLSPDGSRLLIKQGWSDREQLRVFDTATMKEVLPP